MEGFKFQEASFLRDCQWIHTYHHNTRAPGNSGRGTRQPQSAQQEHKRTDQACESAGTPVSSSKERARTGSKSQALKKLSLDVSH